MIVHSSARDLMLTVRNMGVGRVRKRRERYRKTMKSARVSSFWLQIRPSGLSARPIVFLYRIGERTPDGEWRLIMFAKKPVIHLMRSNRPEIASLTAPAPAAFLVLQPASAGAALVPADSSRRLLLRGEHRHHLIGITSSAHLPCRSRPAIIRIGRSAWAKNALYPPQR